MRPLQRILPFFLGILILSLSAFAQRSQALQETALGLRANEQQALMKAKMAGLVLNKDGKTPLQNVEVQVEELLSQNGQIEVRRTIRIKTGSDGRYLLAGLMIGRVRASVVINNQSVMTRGNRLRDEIFLSDSLKILDFDLSQDPAAKD